MLGMNGRNIMKRANGYSWAAGGMLFLFSMLFSGTTLSGPTIVIDPHYGHYGYYGHYGHYRHYRHGRHYRHYRHGRHYGHYRHRRYYRHRHHW